MTIKEAIAQAKSVSNWSVVDYEPATVNIGFFNLEDDREDETQLETFGNDHEKELDDLWDTLCKELGSSKSSVLYVEVL